MVITKFNIRGLPQFNKNKENYRRSLTFIDVMGDKPHDFKLGVSYITPVEGFIAREISLLLTDICDNHANEEYCDTQVMRFVSKLKAQSKSKLLMFTIFIEFYSEISLHKNIEYLDDKFKGVLTINFIDNFISSVMRYKKKITTSNSDIYKTVTVSDNENPYYHFQFIPLTFVVINTTDFLNISSKVQVSDEILVNAAENIKEVIKIMSNYHNLHSINNEPDSIRCGDDIISNFRVQTINKSAIPNKVYVSGNVRPAKSKGLANVYHDNVLDSYNKELSLVFFIAACLLYYKSSDSIFLIHSFRNSGIDSYDINSLYEFFYNKDSKKDSKNLLQGDNPTLSIILS